MVEKAARTAVVQPTSEKGRARRHLSESQAEQLDVKKAERRARIRAGAEARLEKAAAAHAASSADDAEPALVASGTSAHALPWAEPTMPSDPSAPPSVSHSDAHCAPRNRRQVRPRGTRGAGARGGGDAPAPGLATSHQQAPAPEELTCPLSLQLMIDPVPLHSPLDHPPDLLTLTFDWP